MRHPDSIMNECSICDYSYDQDKKKPLVLPCGHSYCKSCILQMRSSNRNACPECRKNWKDVDIEQLLVCYQLISSSEQDGGANSIKQDACEEHGFKNYFWCETCRKPLCKTCLEKNHKDCGWCLIETAVEKEVTSLKENVAKICVCSSQTIKKVENAIESNNSTLSMVRMFKMKVKELENKVISSKDNLVSGKEKLGRGMTIVKEMNNENFNVNKLQELFKTDELSKACLPPAVSGTILDVAKAFQNLKEDASSETFLTNFSQAKEIFLAGKEWSITNDTEALLAFILLTGTSVRPSRLAIRHTNAWSNLRNKALLSVAAEECNSVSLKYLDSFWTPTPETTKKLKTALKTFNIANENCEIYELVGHLDKEMLLSVKKTSLQVLGFSINSKDDYDALSALEEFHLKGPQVCFTAAMPVEDIKVIEEKYYENVDFHLYFPGVNDEKLLRVNKILSGTLEDQLFCNRVKKIHFSPQYLDS